MKRTRELLQEFIVIVVGFAVVTLLSLSVKPIVAQILDPGGIRLRTGIFEHPIAHSNVLAKILETVACVVVGFRYLHGNLSSLSKLEEIYASVTDHQEKSIIFKKLWVFGFGAITQSCLFAYACAFFEVDFSFRLVLCVMFLFDLLYWSFTSAAKKQSGYPKNNRDLESLTDVHLSWLAFSAIQVVLLGGFECAYYINKESFAVFATCASTVVLFGSTWFDYRRNRSFYFEE